MTGVSIQVVASNEEYISSPLRGGGPNPLCATAERKVPAAPENGRTIGALFTFGTFKFLDLADLDWAEPDVPIVAALLALLANG